MNSTLIFLTIVLMHSIGHAQEPQQLPVEAKKWYTLWHDAPRNEYSGTALSKSNGMYVRVVELRGNWAKVDHYYSPKIATVVASIDSAEGDDDTIFQQYLKQTEQSRSDFLKELRAVPVDRRHRRTMWLNLSRLEAITKFEIPPPKPKQE